VAIQGGLAMRQVAAGEPGCDPCRVGRCKGCQPTIRGDGDEQASGGDGGDNGGDNDGDNDGDDSSDNRSPGTGPNGAPATGAGTDHSYDA
jgi:hypothetical protein